MSTSPTITLPSPGEIKDGAGALVAISALVGTVVATWVRWRRRRRAAQSKRRAEARAIRYLVDAQHHVLRLLNRGQLPEDELQRQEFLIREVRRDLAQADGHEELLAAVDTQEEVVKWIKRTQRIEEKKAQIREQSGDEGK